MGTAAKKPRPMRSRRSGIKSQERINANWLIIKKYIKK